MSFLAPFYLLGALSVLAPIVFHLIRRQPKGAVPISSLMFLSPTPPRLTRRSRLDDWPLLILRGLILLLIAAAFARPFLVESTTAVESGIDRRFVVLIDTSASMQREELWANAQRAAIDAIEQCGPKDAIAVFSFDRDSRLHFATSLDDPSQTGPVGSDPELATKAIQDLRPSWRATDLAAALKEASQWTQSWGDDSSSGAEASPVDMLLVSDMQAGKGVESLQAYPWPENVSVSVERLTPQSAGNASAIVMARVGRDGRIPIRVTRDASATTSPVGIRWQGESPPSDETSWQTLDLPNGRTQTIQLDPPDSKAAKLLLRGDDQSFDNTRYFLTPEPLQLNLAYLGPSADERSDDAEFFLRKVPFDDPSRTVEIKTSITQSDSGELDPATCPLVIVVDPATLGAPSKWEQLKSYVSSGGSCLMVLASPMMENKTSDWTNQWNDALKFTIEEAPVSDYAMISYVDFRDPVFEPFALPQFSDFTKIRYWSYRRLSRLPDAWKTVVSLDGGDPLLLKRPFGDGNIWLLTSGWQPSASQFALSSKFVPFMTQLFESGIELRPIASSVIIGDPIPVDEDSKSTLTRLDEQLNPTEPVDPKVEIQEPGFYRFTDADRSYDFVANLDESESRVGVVDDEQLEKFGVPLTTQIGRTVQVDYERQLRHRELENRQRWWQILLLMALGLIVVETFWGSRRARQTA